MNETDKFTLTAKAFYEKVWRTCLKNGGKMDVESTLMMAQLAALISINDLLRAQRKDQ